MICICASSVIALDFRQLPIRNNLNNSRRCATSSIRSKLIGSADFQLAELTRAFGLIILLLIVLAELSRIVVLEYPHIAYLSFLAELVSVAETRFAFSISTSELVLSDWALS